MAAHRHSSLGWGDRQAQTQGFSESAAVTLGNDRLARLALGKGASTLAVLTSSLT